MKPFGPRARIAQKMRNESTAIRDARNFYVKWGEFPIGYNHPSRPVKKDLKAQRKGVKFVQHPDKTMTLSSEFISGEAVWHYEVGLWTCTKASHGLEFMLNRPAGDVQLELTRRGFTHHW